MTNMAVKKLSVALDESVAKRAAAAARMHGVSLSAWLNSAAERELHIEAGLAAVDQWESEHGALTKDELARADELLNRET